MRDMEVRAKTGARIDAKLCLRSTASMIYGFGVDVFQMLFHLIVQVIDYLLVVDEAAFIVVKVILKSCER